MINININLTEEDYDLLMEIVHKYIIDKKEMVVFDDTIPKEQKEFVYNHCNYVKENIFNKLLKEAIKIK